MRDLTLLIREKNAMHAPCAAALTMVEREGGLLTPGGFMMTTHLALLGPCSPGQALVDAQDRSATPREP